MPPITLAFYDSKPYDRDYLGRTADGTDVVLPCHDLRLTAETARSAQGAQAVCLFVNDRLDRECLGKPAGLGVKLVALRCAGFSNADRVAAGELGLTVIRVPAYSPHAVAQLRALNRKIHRAYNRVHEQNFSLSHLVGFDLHGKTVGIIGTARIGHVTAQILRKYGCRVLAHDPLPMLEWPAEHGISYATVELLLAESDVVNMHPLLTPESHHLLSVATIALINPRAYLVNTTRGKLVERAAVIPALKSGHFGGVVLDVYEEAEGIFFEDHSGAVLQDDELVRLPTFPNVLITAHQESLTHEALSEFSRVTLDSVVRLRDGSAPVAECVVA